MARKFKGPLSIEASFTPIHGMAQDLYAYLLYYAQTCKKQIETFISLNLFYLSALICFQQCGIYNVNILLIPGTLY